MGRERSAEIVQRLTILGQGLVGLSAFRHGEGIIRLGGQPLAEIVDCFLVVTQSQVKTATIETAEGSMRIVLYSD